MNLAGADPAVEEGIYFLFLRKRIKKIRTLKHVSSQHVIPHCLELPKTHV